MKKSDQADRLEARRVELEREICANAYAPTMDAARELFGMSKFRHEVHVVRVLKPLFDELTFLNLRKETLGSE